MPGSSGRAAWRSAGGLGPPESPPSLSSSVAMAIVAATLLFYVELEPQFPSHYIFWESFLYEETLQGVFLKTKKKSSVHVYYQN